MLLGLSLILAQICMAQSRKPRPPKGPRATGLLQLTANGQAHLIPIVILIDGKYYDAGAYKASPVPMALESGTVYEAFRTGNSEGLFTVTQVRQLKDDWIADGTWRVAGSEPAKEAASAPSKPVLDEDDGPPKLRRSGAAAPAETPAASPTVPSPAPAATTAQPAPPPPQPEPEPDDPNRPVLHRGPSKPAAKVQSAPSKPEAPKSAAPPEKSSTATQTPLTVQLIPAISDVHGPEPHPYTYDMKPDEEQRFRTRMLALAADEVRARDKQLSAQTIEPTPARPAARSRTPKPPQPNFEDVQLRVFDLSSSNEPTLVLTATARMPQSPAGSSDRQYFLTLVARNDIYNEVHKGFSNLTDSQHLDVTSRLDLIDAVDVDGDGRGELLFRQTSDTAHGYAIYRVVGDQLYPLYRTSSGQ